MCYNATCVFVHANNLFLRSSLDDHLGSTNLNVILGYHFIFYYMSFEMMQIHDLADIARCIASTPMDEQYLPDLVTCMEDLQEVIQRRKLVAVTVQTFGTRIEKLLQ